jgi:hypothetical protein
MADHEIRLDIEAKKKGQGLEQTAQEGKQLDAAIRDLRAELERSERSFENAKSLAITLKTEYKSLKASGEGTKDMFMALSRQISQAEERELSAITATRKLVAEIKSTGDESIATSDDLADLNKRLQESEGYITGVGGKAALQAQKMDELRSATDRTGDELKELGSKADDANSSLRRVGDGLDDAGHSLDNIEKKVGTAAYAMGSILADGLRDAAQAAIEFGKESYESFRAFDDEARRTFAQTPGMSADMRDNLVGDAKVMAAQIGRLPEEVLPALRKALNLGISEDNLLSSIETASMAARIGGESLIDTMVLGQSVVNAYGGELYNLTDTYDYLNYITQSSGLEFADLNGNMNQIISAAAEAGVGLDSVAGAMITMNRQGDDAAEIGGLLSNVLTQISIEGTALGMAFEQAAGVGFRAFTAGGGTLSEGLAILQEHAEATGQDLLNMVGGSSPFYRDVQAARGVLELTGKHAADLAENTRQAAAATGSLAAAATEFEGGAALTYDRAAASIGNLKLATGQWIAQLADGINLIENTNAVASLLSGTLDQQIGKQTDDIVQQARATGEYAEALKKLVNASEGGGAFDFGLDNQIQTEIDTILRDMAATSTSYEDFVASIGQSNATLFTRFGQDIGVFGAANDQVNLSKLYIEERQRGVINYYQALADADYWQSEVTGSAIKAGNAVQQFYANQAAGLYQQKEALEVLEVLDGDTVTVQIEGEMKDIRFRNVNAPEIEHLDAAAMPWAYEAMAKTQKYFDDHPLDLQGQMSRESYGRIIAAVPEIERDLVASGLALPLPASLSEDPETFAELEKLTQRAAAAGVGMFEDQALAARVLNGEMVDLGVYYEELAVHQEKLTGYFSEATGPVTTLFEAYQALADAPAWGIDEAKNAVVEGNTAIVESYQTTAYEIYLAQNGVTEGTIAMGTAMGIFTEQEGLARLEFANTQTAIEELIIAQDEFHLSDQELIAATQLLIDGLAATPAAAADAVKGLETLRVGAAGARDAVGALASGLDALNGRRTSSEHTHTVTTVKRTVEEKESDKGGGTDKPPSGGGVPQYSGGNMWPGTAYLVGDTPSGRPTPYSEIIVPQQPMVNLGAQNSQGLLNNKAQGSIQIVNHFYMNAEGADLDRLFAVQTSSLTQAAASIGMPV